MYRGLALGALLLLSAPSGADEKKDEPGKVDFNRDIRPLLANNCLLCHGPDPKERKGDLRLDLREAATALRDGVAAIVPGKPEASELVKRITSKDREEMMPPPKSGKRLTAPQIELLRRWIAEGAPYAKHWSFLKPVRPPLPSVKDGGWLRNEIDRFILARLEKEGLKPLPEADRTALIRRVSLDLTGLPPAVEEVDRFVADRDSTAYEKVVDRVLASPAYGERWAKVWLDLARYADSQGYAEDRPRTIFAFRDWVIRALNDNVPFDRFTIEQLAGDLLPSPTEEQLKATAFHRNTLTNTEGGTDDEEFRTVAVVDRVNTTMAVWMGLTINCAQCHDHKYDPFSQEEFYKLFAFFNSTEDYDQPDDRPFLPLWSDEQKKQKKEWEEEIPKLEAKLRTPAPELEAGQKRWEAGFARPVAWRPHEAGAALDLKSLAALKFEGGGEAAIGRVSAALVPGRVKATPARFVRVELPGKGKILSLAEVQVFSDGANVGPQGKAAQSSVAYEGHPKRAIDGVTNGDYFAANSVTHTNTEDSPWWEVDLGKVRPVERIVVWNRTDGGAEVSNRIKGFRVRLLDEERKNVDERKVDLVPNPQWTWSLDGVRPLRFRAAHADAEKKGFEAKNVLGADAQKPGWKGGTQVVLALEAAVDVPAGMSLHVTLKDPSPGLKLFVTDDPNAVAYADVPGDVRASLKKPDRSKDEAEKVAAYYRSVAPELAATRERLAAVRKQLADLKPAATVPVMKELPQRRKTQVHIRGNFLVRGKEVREGVPAALHPFPEGAPKNRLGLARWLVHPDNPLAARVVVNRYWEQLFGVGLVATSEDWGVRGELPLHPELLDWLATEFVAQKWDVKKLVRLLVTSATYRQSSQVTPEILARDPSNRLLARGPRLRLSAEDVRDQALFVSGLLSRKVGGPSVYPQRPKMGLNAAFSSSLDWETSKGEDKFRRGLYTFWRRSIPYPSMATFDAPDRNVCTVRRIPTNTPLQALVTMNDPVYVEASQALARRIAKEGGASARDRAAYGFRLCVARPPRPAELDRLVGLYDEARARYEKDKARAQAMATDPLGPAPQGADVVDLAAWTVVGNVLLNLDEMFLKR